MKQKKEEGEEEMKFPQKEVNRDSSKDEFNPTPRQRIVLNELYKNETKVHFVKALENEYEVGCETGFEQAKKQIRERDKRLIKKLNPLGSLQNVSLQIQGAKVSLYDKNVKYSKRHPKVYTELTKALSILNYDLKVEIREVIDELADSSTVDGLEGELKEKGDLK